MTQVMLTVFEVESAGCPSCAEKVRAALTPLGRVESVEIDEAADIAVVQVRAAATFTAAVADEALASASVDAGHAYRVKPGTWRHATT